MLDDNTPFETIEAYKTARTNIMFALSKSDKGKKILVTSAEPGEGKTTTTINLAIVFSLTGAKTIIVDCDLRKPMVRKYLKIEKKEGVTNVLCGFSTLDKAINKNVRNGLDCIHAGEIHPHPIELLTNDKFINLLKELEKRYDYVFIDTPPVTTVTDAVTIANLSTGVVIVVKQNTTNFTMLNHAVGNIERSKAKILGFVVNGVSHRKKQYGDYPMRV